MLVLARRLNEEIRIECEGRRVVLKVIEISRGSVRLGLVAPSEVLVYRNELVPGETSNDNGSSDVDNKHHSSGDATA
jgi:carbon storage regulator CsrA